MVLSKFKIALLFNKSRADVHMFMSYVMK